MTEPEGAERVLGDELLVVENVRKHFPVTRGIIFQKEYASIKAEVDRAIASVVERQEFIMGREIPELEAAVAALSQTKHGIGCASGTDAILLPLKALGLEPAAATGHPALCRRSRGHVA